MKRSTLLPGLLLCLSALQLQAQDKLKGGTPDAKLAPTLSGDGNQGSIYSPNLFNGTANVTVPIYSYSDKGISLSYNTAGLKVDELPGQVGLHWSLNAGGSITRVVKDVPDEINTYNSTSVPFGSGDVGDYSMGIKGKWARYFGGLSPAGEVDNDGKRYSDDECDDFIFSVGGLSFTFNIGSNRYVFTNPQTNVKIDILVNGNPVTQMPLSSDNSSLNFRVRDAQGNWYYFTKGDVSYRLYPIPGSPGGNIELQYTSKWVISKIVQNDGSEINYQYNNVDIHNTGLYTTMYHSFTSLEKTGTPTQEESIVTTDNLLYSTKYITAISYPNNIVATFTYNSGSRCDDITQGGSNPVLREIKVAQGEGGIRYVMDQAYSLAPRSGSTVPSETAYGSCYDISAVTDDYRYHRLILKGIHMTDLDGVSTEPYYSFAYNTDVRLPPRFSGAQDYYGYYNGKTVTPNSGMFSIPLHTPKFGSGAAYGVDRSVDNAYTAAGLLKTITNASGGITEFSYEGHILSNVLSDAGITLPTDAYFYGATANDGVRIKSVKTSDARYPNIYTTQNYTYNGGQRFMPGGYFDYPSLNGGSNTLFNSSFVTPHQFINGSNHGYSSVTVTTFNNSSQLLSMTLNTFQNVSRGSGSTSYYSMGTKNYFQLPYTDKQYIKDWEIGLPLTTTEYDQGGRIVASTENTYASQIDNNASWLSVENVKIFATTDNANINTEELIRENYRPYRGMSLLTKTVTKKYITSSTFISDEVNYKYDSHNNLERTITTNSRGESFMLKNIYNYAVSGPNVPFGSQAGTLYNMSDDNLEFTVGIERWKLNSADTPFSYKLFDASITCFEYQNSKINTKKLFTLRSLAPISYTEYTGINNLPANANAYIKILAAYNTSSPVDGFQQASEVLQFDSKGNPLETKISDQPVYKSMLWDAPVGNKVADVSNARLKDIGFTSFEHSPGVSYPGSGNSTDGGFTFNLLGNVSVTDAISGDRVFKLVPPGTTVNNSITSPVLTAGITYVMTFWSKNGSPGISGAGLGSISFDNIHSKGAWTQWMATFTPASNGSIQFSSTQTIYVDEIRLFPKGAQMTNTVYAPMSGPTSTTDVQGRITYYLYDAFGRQTAVKDQDGNVITKQERHLAQ